MHWKTAIVFFVGVVVGVAVSQSMQAALDAYVSSAIKGSIGNALAISRALELYKQDNGRYPELSSGGSRLAEALAPKYLREVPNNTNSGRPYVVLVNGPAAVIAPGRGGFIVQNGEVAFFQPYRTVDGKPGAQTRR